MIILPRGDRTGPEGLGPMTGRAAGYCAGFNRPGVMNNNVVRNNSAPRNLRLSNRASGRGRGLGAGRGLGRRNRW